ncbi:MAG: hypothetical protein GEU73_04205 [Chloroflexi bacterium]|nr:hypothetical protein [Chloroflexota bacterium]
MAHVSSPFTSLEEYAHARGALLQRITCALQADARVDGAWLSGSFGRGEADPWADLDLHVAVADAHYPAFLTERGDLYARVGRPVLIQEDMPSDCMPGGRFQLVLFAGLLEVDWNIGPTREAVKPLAFQPLLDRVPIPVVSPPALTPDERRARADERLTFFWAMAPIAVKYVGRTESERAVRQIDLLTQAAIALYRLALQPDGPSPSLHSVNRLLEPEIDTRLPRLGTAIDPFAALEVIRALCAEVEQLHPTLAALGVAIPFALPSEVAGLIALAETVARRRPQLPRT